MKSRLIIIILLVFSLISEAQIRSTFWSTIRNTIRHNQSINPPVETPKYYFSSTGSDSNDGLTDATPKQTITALNALTLAPGDYVALKSGDSFTGTITIGQSGTSGNPIKIGSYGTGEKPKIYGSDIISGGWTVHSGNIYKKTGVSAVSQVFANGTRLKAARLNNTTFNLVTAVTSQTVFTTDATSQSANYYVGCKVIIRTVNYLNETRTVTASSGSQITINSAPSGTIVTGNGIVLMNKLEFLDQAGEWYYDSATSTLYIWTPGGDTPANYEIRGSVRNSGITINQKSFVTINNLDILHQTDKGIDLTGEPTNNITVSNCNIYGQGNYSISGAFGDNGSSSFHLYENNTISGSSRTGLYVYNLGNSIIRNNTITNTGLFDSWGIIDNTGGSDGCTAIDVSDNFAIGTNTIELNNIINAGYNGILWRGNALIQKNYINAVCLAKSDGAGIYTGSSTSNGSIVKYNIVDFSEGPKVGSSSTRNWGEGIYLDENSVGITVEHNTVVGATEASIYLHKPYNHTVRYNKVLSNRYGLWYANTPTGTSTFTNNLIALTAYADADAYEPRNLLVRGATTTVSLNNNTYINPFPTSDIVFRKVDGTYTDFEGWQATSQDASSTYDGTDFLTNETQRLIYNNTNSTKTFYPNAATGSSITGSFTVNAFESKYVRGINIDCILDYSDATAPTITAFDIPSSSSSAVITINTFTATGTPTKYLITESATTPLLTNAAWSATVPTTYTATGTGTVTLYAWVRDAAGNISAAATDVTTVPNVAANLIADYNFHETSGTVSTDLKGTANGTVYGTPSMDGTKYNLDGVDDYVKYPLPSVITSNSYLNDFSINIKFSIPATPGATKRIFYQAYSYTRGLQIAVNTNRDVYGIITENATAVTSGKITSGGLTISQVYNITITWDATAKILKLYKDGTEITATYASNSLSDDSSGMIIGSANNTAWINASVYEFSVFNKKLDSSEVTQWIGR